MKTLLAITAACMLATSALAQESATFAERFGEWTTTPDAEFGCTFLDPIFSREPVTDPTFSREAVADVAEPAATGADPDKPSATMVVASGDKARPNLCARLFTVAAELNTPQWLVALNASPIEAVELPIITAAAAWINGTPPAMGDVMAYGEE